MCSCKESVISSKARFTDPRHRIILVSSCHPAILTISILTNPILHSDDTSVAIVEKLSKHAASRAKIHFLENVTADCAAFRGIHPVQALESHQEKLANLVNKAISHLPPAGEERFGANQLVTVADGSKPRRKPDFISVTRGPGMRANLFVGLDTAKGLAVAWQIPFVGVHHMQAHLLTPRLVSSVKGRTWADLTIPKFPFMSLLVSGGHTLLVNSTSLTEHEVMANTADNAIGDAIDKAARLILPESVIQTEQSTAYGKILEQFAFPNGPRDYSNYSPPMSRGDELIPYQSKWGWSLTTPLANSRDMRFSFSGIGTAVERIVSEKRKAGQELCEEERVDLARATMQTSFEHLASRLVIGIQSIPRWKQRALETIVISGGVASNKFLMTVLKSFLEARGYGHLKFVSPPAYLCTDNAAMIGWAGIEMFEMGWRTELSARALKKWSLDVRDEEGGLLGPVGWSKHRAQN